MGKLHKKLTFQERELIFGLAKEGRSVRYIARILERSPSSISEELRRSGMTIKSYVISVAQVDRNIKATLKGRKRKLIEGKQPLKQIRLWIQKNKWSPEQVAGRLKIKFKRDPQKQVSHETIYKYIYSLKDAEELNMYVLAMRRRRKKRKSRTGLKMRRGPVPNAISIHERPAEVESREIPGHWEGDSIVGRDHGSAIGTLVERTFRYTIIVDYGDNKTSNNVAIAFAKAYESIPEGLRKSLTFDRGAEMAQHELFTQLTGTPVYFADPGTPGQRGTNENTNGLIRQFFPKKTDFSKVSSDELKQVENMLNLRPRKVLGYKSPLEMLNTWKNGPEPPLRNKHRSRSGEESGGDLVPR